MIYLLRLSYQFIHHLIKFVFCVVDEIGSGGRRMVSHIDGRNKEGN